MSVSDHPPPPYTHTPTVMKASLDNTIFLQRSIIEILAFAYKISSTELSAALQATTLPNIIYTKDNTSYSLSAVEHENLFELAQAVRRCTDRVAKNNYSLLSTSDIALIHSNIIKPCQELGITAAYICYLLSYYSKHRCNPSKHHLAFAYFSTSWLWRRRSDIAQTTLQKQMISDDILVEYIAPWDALRVLLGTGISRMRVRHVHVTRSLERTTYGWVSQKNMLEVVEQRVSHDAPAQDESNS
ncbi:hypothetical protein BDV96DRAFT_600220 [Lophiotrema nucula]|uniref:Uncharacterized protein n=1 Tax=Lophiotrema nucula TaxID=690887 RepID=A0A6A5Z722_9PLEO|nr:hypothetical protein BDV96DRAFT_600220 [Lophiotrema nucula]